MTPGATVICSIALATVGCANLETIGRRTDLPGGGKAIHLDAPQRLAYTNKKGHLCAEPSPDALQAYAASLGAAVAVPERASVALTDALSANSAGIGLRTQAITLMRDALYRICEAEHNDAIGPGDTMQLLERSQDLTLAVLAIEQLTGAVVARQPILTTGANGTAAANINNSQAALDQAKKDEATKMTAVTDATTDRDKKKALVATTTVEASSAKTAAAATQSVIESLTPKLAAENPKLVDANTALFLARAKVSLDETQLTKLTQALKDATAAKDQAKIADINKQIATLNTQKGNDSKEVAKVEAIQKSENDLVTQLTTAIAEAHKDPQQQAYDKVAKTLSDQQDDLKKAEDKLTAATKDDAQAKTVVAALQANLDNAVASGSSSTTGSGAFAPANDRGNISKDTVAEIAKATVSIVDRVVKKGHLTDTCTNLITAYFNQKADSSRDKFDGLIEICNNVLAADLEVYIKSSGEAAPSLMQETR